MRFASTDATRTWLALFAEAPVCAAQGNAASDDTTKRAPQSRENEVIGMWKSIEGWNGSGQLSLRTQWEVNDTPCAACHCV
jgi:hypothetical protein